MRYFLVPSFYKFWELGPIKNAVTCSMTIVHRFIVRVTIKVISFCHLEKWFIPRISCLCRTIYGLPFSIISLNIGCRDTIIFEIVITKLQLFEHFAVFLNSERPK